MYTSGGKRLTYVHKWWKEAHVCTQVVERGSRMYTSGGKRLTYVHKWWKEAHMYACST